MRHHTLHDVCLAVCDEGLLPSPHFLSFLAFGEKCVPTITVRRSQYTNGMLEPVILAIDTHANGTAASFTASIIDDPNDGETKLVVMFEQEGHIAVFSLDRLIEEEDISRNSHLNNADKLEEALRSLIAARGK